MDNKEIILSKIAEILNKQYFIKKNNSEFKSRLKCVGLGEYFDKYSNYLIPYDYNNNNIHNHEYNVFLGLDYIFTDLYREGKNSDIISLLCELTKSFNIGYIEGNLDTDFNELVNLYELFGLSISINFDEVTVTTCMASDEQRVVELFSVESWLKENHIKAYDSYESAIDDYTQGHIGTCIESCRTCLVSIFSEYKGTENFAKWIRGPYNISGENTVSSVKDLSQALKTELNKDDLADFFCENRNGKLTKTKTIYMIYSMLSDYGTHRNESYTETPTLEDALFSLRLTDSILFWIYSKKKL